MTAFSLHFSCSLCYFIGLFVETIRIKSMMFLIYENKSVNDIAERIHKDSCLISIIVNLHKMVVPSKANHTRTPSHVV